MTTLLKFLISFIFESFLEKIFGKYALLTTAKGLLLKLGIIGILLMLSFMLIVVAGLVGLTWALLNNL